MDGLSATTLTLTARRGGAEPERRDDRLVLRGEWEWLLRGPASDLALARAALAGVAEHLADDLLLLSFGNAVGFFDVPGLGRLEVVSGKWDQRHFARMLDDLTMIAAGLPFAASETAALPYDRAIADQPDVLYHLFAYLRHILSDDPPPERRLLPALRLILREPHQRFAQTRRTVPIELARGLDPAGFVGIATGAGGFSRVPPAIAARLPVARALRGHLPQRVDEPHAVITRDTPENRFVKSFLGQAGGILARMRRAMIDQRASTFRNRVLADCDTMDAVLHPILSHALWSEVGPMVHLPAASPVLQRRRGYREVYGHFGRLRLATRLPLAEAAMRDLLAAKDIAHLYELWCFFTLVEVATRLLGPPRIAERPHADDFQVGVRWDLAVTWPDGTRLLYNPRFARSRAAERRTYSVPLRPDIALVVPTGAGAGLQLFDAKFRLDRLDAFLPAAGAEDETDEERAEERRGTFKRADLYKMHTYRDAIPRARSVWVLYPGTEFRLFRDDATLPVATSPHCLGPGILDGVGAVPLAPDGGVNAAIELVLDQLLGTAEGTV